MIYPPAKFLLCAGSTVTKTFLRAPFSKLFLRYVVLVTATNFHGPPDFQQFERNADRFIFPGEK